MAQYPYSWNNGSTNTNINPSQYLANLRTNQSSFISPQDTDVFDEQILSGRDNWGKNIWGENNRGKNNGDTNNLGQKFDLGLNMGTLKLGTAIMGAYNGWQANKRQGETNDLARAELAQNAKSFDINTGMQLATLQAEEARRNAYAGGFLDNSQRSDRFKDYDLQKLNLT